MDKKFQEVSKITITKSRAKRPKNKEARKINFLTLFRMVIFEAAHGWREGLKKSPLLKIYHTYPTMMKLGTVVPYLKKI